MASIQLQIASTTLPFKSSVITSVAELTILAKIDFSSTVSIKSVVFNPVASQLGLHVGKHKNMNQRENKGKEQKKMNSSF